MDKIVCFGKNYSDHMRELGDQPVEKPVIFLKPPSVLRQCEQWGGAIDATLTDQETHYETEIVLKLKSGGYRLSKEAAMAAIGSYSIGLDMTLREVQAGLKKAGHPWTTGKVFPDAAIIGPWIEVVNFDFLKETFSLTLDDVRCQESTGTQMLFNPVDLIVYASHFFPLCEGDILFTGTPKGVGKVHDQAHGRVQIGTHYYTVKWQKAR
jgi:acylpyruvate hydrolase